MKKLRQIVVVDDDQLSCMVTQMQLENFDFAESVVAFNDPERALAYFATVAAGEKGRVAPDLMLTDFHMPGMTGLQLIKQVRQMGAFPSIVCCILSGSAEFMDQLELQAYGADGQLAKPLDRQLLKDFLQHIQLLKGV